MQSAHRSLTRLQLSRRASDIRNAEKIGVALGPGLPAGLVSIGMLLGLRQLKIPVSMISGTSMGAMLGAFFASGMSPNEMREKAIALFANDGVVRLLKEDAGGKNYGSSGEKLFDELKRLAGWDPEFYELKIPLFVVAADKVTQQNVILSHGKVFDAVRASIAMPLLLEERQLGGMQLADGAIFSPMDTSILYNEGADFVLAMHAKIIRSAKNREIPRRKKLEPRFLRMLGWKTEPDIYFSNPGCDVLLRPRVPQAMLSGGDHAKEIINLGIKITYEAIHEIDEGNYSPRISPPQKEPDAASMARVDAEMNSKVDDIEEYLIDLGQKSANLPDAELMKLFPEFSKQFQIFLEDINEKFPDPETARDVLRDRLKNFADVVNESPFMSRCFHKPLGYAGDYQMMNYMYDDDVLGDKSNMGKFLDYYLFSNPAANAVRNRAKIVQGLVQHRLAGQSDLRVASIACGPAREVAATMNLIASDADKTKITWTLLDQDRDALANARKNLPATSAIEPNFINAGVQDIIYSLGLFDYLEDKLAIRIIQMLYGFLNPGGILLIGNFDVSNPSRALMEGLMEWHLIHRTEEDMMRLAKAATSEGRHFVMAEPEGINLILVSSKPLQDKKGNA
ncbi:MAG: patatin-like phospholipase family protein [bacterium]